MGIGLPGLRQSKKVGDPKMHGTGLWLAGNEGLNKKMETTTAGYTGITSRIHPFIAS